MIGMRATRYHFFLDLICQNYFAQSGLVKECLSASQQSDIAKTNILFNLHHLPFFCGDRQKSNYNYISIKTTNPIFQISSFFVFRQLNSLSCGICLSFKSRHLELFCQLLFSYPLQVFFQGYGQEVHLAILQNNFFCTTE